MSSSCTQHRGVGYGPTDRFQSIKKLAAVQIHPPRNPNKPLTPFSIKDILTGRVPVPVAGQQSRKVAGGGGGGGRGSGVRPVPLKAVGIVRPWDSPGSRSSTPGDLDEEIEVEDVKPPTAKNQSPLDALFKMTNKTFDGTDKTGVKPEDGSRRDQLNLFSKTQPAKKRRKSRTAFTNQQIYELEKRFLYQKYLTPADRDEIASSLGLTNAQVITWFQNRRAKLKRDLEELKADVTAAKSCGSESGGDDGRSMLDMSVDDDECSREDVTLFNDSESRKAEFKNLSPSKDILSLTGEPEPKTDSNRPLQPAPSPKAESVCSEKSACSTAPNPPEEPMDCK